MRVVAAGHNCYCGARCVYRGRLPWLRTQLWIVRHRLSGHKDKGKRDTPLIHLLWVNWVYYGKKYLLGKEV